MRDDAGQPISGPAARLTPSETIAQGVDVEPGIGLVQQGDTTGFSIAIWRISIRFFSPPEKPSFR